MLCALIVSEKSLDFEEYQLAKISKSFLPVENGINLLTNYIGIFNKYFSIDKIFVVCSMEQYKVLKSFKTNIKEENFIIEPEKINFYISIYYASLILEKMYSDENVLFINVDKLLLKTDIYEWIQAIDNFSYSENLVIGIEELDRYKSFDFFIEAGKSYGVYKNYQVFEISNLAVKKKNIFGKQGVLLDLIAGFPHIIVNKFSIFENSFFYNLKTIFIKNMVSWNKLIECYNFVDEINLNYYKMFENELTIFISNYFYKLENWLSYLKVLEKKVFSTGNVVFDGEVENVVVVNNSDNEICVRNMKNVIVCVDSSGIKIRGFF